MRDILKQNIFRNQYSRDGTLAQKGKVNLEYYQGKVNLGDQLSPLVCAYLLEKQGLSLNGPSANGKTRHLVAIGSLLGGRGEFDATVWGSGIHNLADVCVLHRRKFYRKLDIRAVRGPLTREALRACGHDCPEVYGDPGVLMPLIYQPKPMPAGETVVVRHFRTALREELAPELSYLDIATQDYRGFLDALSGAKKVISSSLHGIILAESYGIPAVLLQPDENVGLMKFYDWYFSTQRKNVRIASTMEEAMAMEPMPLPNLGGMQAELMGSFPYDLWRKAL